MSSATIIQIILAILLPPVAVFTTDGCGAQLIINVVLFACFIFPAVIHALYLVWVDKKHKERVYVVEYDVRSDGSGDRRGSQDSRFSRGSRGSRRGRDRREVHFE
ncbi:uncharacterized protein RCC_07442 [Ramularia collo-cygni]|uniref:Plasma membrane proteolipid 3 n=1 Tax=Ramularia collo-cygni TaxID=112498 RepID=A0A2D3V1A8_9PEZI|nr:uncharacterized protein RCC_07442 [Ramularia collo-cygni]CZT21578.1 uncharacterized protein RCC_07442 [Ramularia collo-cygni]